MRSNQNHRTQVYVPNGADSENLTQINDRLVDELRHLVQSLESQFNKHKEVREREMESKMNDEAIRNHDEDLTAAQIKVTQLKKDIK